MRCAKNILIAHHNHKRFTTFAKTYIYICRFSQSYTGKQYIGSRHKNAQITQFVLLSINASEIRSNRSEGLPHNRPPPCPRMPQIYQVILQTSAHSLKVLTTKSSNHENSDDQRITSKIFDYNLARICVCARVLAIVQFPSKLNHSKCPNQ